jgi:hypothetical protein
MHPAQVGALLDTVELRWEEARASSLRHLTDEKVALEDMIKSCSKVSKAIIAGSDGDRDKVVEYMQDVCTAITEQDKSDKCQKFSSGIEGALTDDAGFNRNELELSKFCQAFWNGPVTVAAKVFAEKAAQEDEEKAKQEAKEEEEKDNEALAATQAEQTQAANEAVNKTAEAKQHADEVDKLVEGLEVSMETNDKDATKLLDQARQAEQVAAEKETKAAEPQTVTADAAAEADEAKALAEGDAKADAIADKAVEKAGATEPLEQNVTAAEKDDTEAIAAGDKVAEKIADKALKKAALVVAKKNTTVEGKNTTVEGKKATVVSKKVTDAPAPKKVSEPKKDAKKVEVAKTF